MAKVPSAKVLSRLANGIFGDIKEIPSIVQEGRRALHTGEGTHSFVLWPLLTAIKKLKGQNKIDKLLYEKYHRSLINADERLGRILAQHGPSQKLFAVKETLPTKYKLKGLPASVEHETFSASAPVKKLMNVVTPMAAGMYITDKLGAKTGATMAKDNAKDLMKKAADTIESHRRRDEAVKLAMHMVERGKCEPFKSFSDFEEKVAMLESKNLEAVREALDMDGDLADFGKVASPDTTVPLGSNKAEIDFFHRLSE